MVGPCETCGSIGQVEKLATCCKCRMVHKHTYCNWNYVEKRPKKWTCEDCTSGEGITSPRNGGKEGFQNSSDTPNRDILKGSSKICNNMTKRDVLETQKNGKVKFLDAEEAIKLASEATRRGSSSKISTIYRSSFSSVSSKFSSPEKGSPSKVNFSSRPKASSSKALETASLDPEHESGRTATTNVPAKDVAICNAYAKKAKSNISGRPSTSVLGLPTTGSSIPCTVTEQKIPDAQKGDPLHVLRKLHFYQPYLPALEPTWSGLFKFFGEVTSKKLYGGFVAQPASRVHRRAHEFSKQMPTVLEIQLLPQSYALVGLFHNDFPEIHDIAIYLFASPIFQGSEEDFRSLARLLEMEKSVIRSYIAGVELLILSPKQLHGDSQDFLSRYCERPFLWGVFHNMRS